MALAEADAAEAAAAAAAVVVVSAAIVVAHASSPLCRGTTGEVRDDAVEEEDGRLVGGGVRANDGRTQQAGQ